MENGVYDLLKYIVLLPLIGFALQVLFGKAVVKALGPKNGRRVMGGIAVAVIAVAFAIGVSVFYSMLNEPPSARFHPVMVAPWINLVGFRAPIEFLADPLSITMVLIITGIGALIHLYATGYMAEDRDYTRFFTYMNLFVASMLVLVLANNLVLLFVGWEGVGLCSYLLIGFWYKDLENTKAANKAFIVNRIGDFGFMLGMFLLFCVMVNASGLSTPDHNYLSFDQILLKIGPILSANPWVATPIALLLFVGAMGKSAQFPLYFWLPDAMAGPTPVSALIHAATMVTSGIFLLNRLWPIFAASPIAGVIIAVVGAFTALYAAVIAFGQTDIKKVLAFSTVSQLGYMFLACGAGNYSAGMFHVTTHAFFKALLFLGAGAVIHAMAHNQDMRAYGGLRKYLPITFICMLVGYLAIAGFPGLAGFFSKDEILAASIGSPSGIVQLAGYAALITAFLTAVYMGRLTFLAFWGDERWRTAPAEELHPHVEHEKPLHIPPSPLEDPHGFYYSDAEIQAIELGEEDHAHHEVLAPDFTPHEVPISMWLPLVLLAIPSAVAGWILSPLFEKWLYPVGISPEVQFTAIKWLPYAGSAAAILGIIVGYAVYAKGLPANEGWDMSKWNPFVRFAGLQFCYDHFMSGILGGKVSRATGRVMSNADHDLVEGSVNSVGFVAEGFGLLLRKLQTGFVRTYALLMLLGVLGLVGWLLFAARGLS